jgi:hypothetical protein
LKPGGKPAKLARDLGYLKQIKDAFGADRKLTDITQAEVAKWRDNQARVSAIVGEPGLHRVAGNREQGSR